MIVIASNDTPPWTLEYVHLFGLPDLYDLDAAQGGRITRAG